MTRNQPSSLQAMSHIDVIRNGLDRMESFLDECAEILRAQGIDAPIVDSTDSLERKVRLLILAPERDAPEEESLMWLGQAILDIQALLSALESDPESSDQKIAGFLNEWFADTDAPAWAGKSTTERLHQLLGLFCAALEGFRDGTRNPSVP